MKVLSALTKISQASTRCPKRYMLCLCPPVLFCQATLKQSLYSRLFSTDISCQTAQDVADYLKSNRVQKVVVMAGAGISTPSGIPDFRSPGTGLYDNLQKYNLPYPEAVFDLDYFDHDPKAFYTLAHELYPNLYRPNVAHYLVRLLYEKGLLYRMYTQNIDGLERLAGIPEEKLVEAHGSFSKATCRVCSKSYTGKDIEESIFKGEIPRCTRKLCKGVIKPDIVFFGEQLPMRFWRFTTDLPQADLLIVMGTSLEVYPFAGVAEAVLPGTPRILFNKEATGSFADNPRKNDVILSGDLVSSIKEFCQVVGWKAELNEIMKRCEEDFNSDKHS